MQSLINTHAALPDALGACLTMPSNSMLHSRLLLKSKWFMPPTKKEITNCSYLFREALLDMGVCRPNIRVSQLDGAIECQFDPMVSSCWLLVVGCCLSERDSFA